MRLLFALLPLILSIGLSSAALSVVQQFLTSNDYNLRYKYGSTQVVKWITIHNTANKASAQNEATYLNNRRDNVSISFHYVVDDKQAIQLLPENINGWHAGDGAGEGNKASIGVEIAYSTAEDINLRDRALENGARLAARLLKSYKFTTNQLRKHQDWSGKRCPHDILDRYGWTNFVNLVQTKMNTGDM